MPSLLRLRLYLNNNEKGNNIFNTDETNITKDRIIGKAVLKIPYLGWPKIWLVEGLKLIFG